MNWYWGPRVHAVMHGRDLVVLDADRNDYVVLPLAERSVRLEPSGVGATIDDADLISELADAGLGTRARGADRRPSLALLPADADLYDRPDPTVSVAFRAKMAILSARVSARLNSTQLSTIVEPRLSSEGQGAAADVIERALVLRAVLPWLPFQGQCLYRAALLRAHLKNLAPRTCWVFGVSTWPFAAHCWVQFDGLVLNDRLLRVRRYTPILAV